MSEKMNFKIEKDNTILVLLPTYNRVDGLTRALESIKRQDYKNWKIALWRTKDGEEVDFIIEKDNGEILAVEVKLSIHGADSISIPSVLSKTFPDLKQIILVTFDGKKQWLSKQCLQIPVAELTNFLIQQN